MSGWHILFLPHVSWTVFWVAAALGAATIAAMLYGKMRGSLLRALGLVLLLGALANPQLSREERQYLADIVTIIVDDSQSQSLANRRTQTDEALAALKSRLQSLGTLDVRVGRTVTGATPDTDGTRVFAALQRIMADVPPERFGGDRKSTRLNSSHVVTSRMPSSA